MHKLLLFQFNTFVDASFWHRNEIRQSLDIIKLFNSKSVFPSWLEGPGIYCTFIKINSSLNFLPTGMHFESLLLRA